MKTLIRTYYRAEGVIITAVAVKLYYIWALWYDFHMLSWVNLTVLIFFVVIYFIMRFIFRVLKVENNVVE